MSFEANATEAERLLADWLVVKEFMWLPREKALFDHWRDEIAARQPAPALDSAALESALIAARWHCHPHGRYDEARAHIDRALGLLAQATAATTVRSISHWGMFEDASPQAVLNAWRSRDVARAVVGGEDDDA